VVGEFVGFCVAEVLGLWVGFIVGDVLGLKVGEDVGLGVCFCKYEHNQLEPT
jgi:hypothetical protein